MVELVVPSGASAKGGAITKNNNNNPYGPAPPVPSGVGWWSRTTALRWSWLCSESTALPGARGLR